MTNNVLRIGSRGSDLALWQARWVQAQLQRLSPGLDVPIEIVKTTGDSILDAPLSKIGDKGLFTKEIEAALLEDRIDLAVHSLKDLPTRLPEGLVLGAICEREDVRDVFIAHPSNPVRMLLDQPRGAKIATGSLRRRCQLLALRDDFDIIELRGNLNTRMKKLEESDWAGMMLARAGVLRLGWAHRISDTLSPEVMLPAVGQGALGIEIRESDSRSGGIVQMLDHAPTRFAALAERSLLRRLEGGCQIPIGTFARLTAAGTELQLDAVVGSLDGKRLVRGTISAAPSDAEAMGRRLAEQLLRDGAEEILLEIRDHGTA